MHLSLVLFMRCEACGEEFADWEVKDNNRYCPACHFDEARILIRYKCACGEVFRHWSENKCPKCGAKRTENRHKTYLFKTFERIGG
jgi:DNA-directed RNA polymerase subunit RPC12/RpoP